MTPLNSQFIFQVFLSSNIFVHISGYEYDIHLQSEGTYGKFYKEEGRWKGMVGDLVSKVLLLNPLARLLYI